MTIKSIKSEIREFENINLMKADDETLEDIVNRLDELLELVDALNEDADEDGETAELMEIIEDLQYSINSELDGRYDESYEEDY